MEATAKAHQPDTREEAAPGAEDSQALSDPPAAADPPREAGHASPEQEKTPEDGAGQSSELHMPNQGFCSPLPRRVASPRPTFHFFVVCSQVSLFYLPFRANSES